MFSKFFINRPIFATVLALLIVVAGLVTLNILPVAQFPEITPPTSIGRLSGCKCRDGSPNGRYSYRTAGEWSRWYALYVFQLFIFGSILPDYHFCRWNGY